MNLEDLKLEFRNVLIINPTELDYAYIAGFFDAEGHVGVYKRKNSSIRLQCGIKQNDNLITRKVFYKLCNWFGGSVTSGFNNKGHHIYWGWVIDSNKASNFLGKILPYLRIKKLQAKMANNWQRQRKKFDNDKVFNLKLVDFFKKIKEVGSVKDINEDYSILFTALKISENEIE